MRTSRVALIGGLLLAAALTFGILSVALAQTVPGSGWGQGGFGRGGMMGGWGQGGMMGGNGRMHGGMMGGFWQGGSSSATPLGSLAEAQPAFQAYLDRLGNADLALGEVMEFQENFYAVVTEKSTGAAAFELLADRQSGVVFPEYGPNMMWNTKYGHMAGSGGMMAGSGGMMAGSGGSMSSSSGEIGRAHV